MACCHPRPDHLLDGQAVFFGKFIIALVMTGNGHNSAGTIAHENKITGPDRHFFACHWMHCFITGINAGFFDGGHVRFRDTANFQRRDFVCQRSIIFCGFQCQWMFRRHGTVGYSHDGIGAGGIDLQWLGLTCYLEIQTPGLHCDQSSFAALPVPVPASRRACPGRPAVPGHSR